MQTLLHDLRFGARMLAKNPIVTAVATFTLALGIGANTAIFSGVNAFVFRALPVPDAGQLARPAELTEDRSLADEFSYPDFKDYRDQSANIFSGMAAEDMVQAALGTQDQNDVIWGQVVSGNYFDVLQIKPVMGRAFLPEEDRAVGATRVVVLGHSLWQRRFNSDPNIVGKTIDMNGRPYNVIGVAPDFFKGTKFALSMDFWAPMAMAEELERSPGLLAARDSHWANIIARLKPGVTFSQASTEFSAIAQRLNQLYPDSRAATTKGVVANEIDGRWEEAAIIMKSGAAIAMAIVGLVLLIACANVANLLLARAAARRKEIGIRLALGASRMRLLRQLLTESLLLSLLGGVLGLVLAYWVVHLLQGFIPVLPYNVVDDFFTIDTRALVFTFVISLATGILFGLAPAWHASSPEVIPVLKGGVEMSALGKRRRFTLRNSLVVIQVALSLLVLVCGALFVKSFRNAQRVDPGFNPQNLLLVTLNPSLIGYDASHSADFFKRLMSDVATLPGVESVGFTRRIPLGDSSNSSGPILKEGEQLARGSAGRNIMNSTVSSNYFKTMQIQIIDGRDFDERDRKDGQKVTVVNEHMAQTMWPGESAVGKRIFVGVDSRDPIEVVGVVKQGKYRALAENPKPFYYYPMTQREPLEMTLVVRASGDPRNLVGAIRNQVLRLDRRMPLYSIKTMEDHMTYAFWAPRMAATLAMSFGLVALLLSAVGLYSVMAYVVSQRTREVGIRMALGAGQRDVLRMITTSGMKLAAIGIVIGLVLSLALARVLSTLLIGISAYDAAAFFAVPVLLLVVAFIASFVPARRATKVDPLVALRYE
jgi:predicted permease